ncbi:undecaprenyldiphospho-muramoylpentapeptide beta-N-acetylglucosaminyltransferase [Luteipulveratus sp. YIM 133132]|uniref:UDP-N-acetylglucosamine--N-acetylmuramyl-(pentapeptide) pyrophosphoryl-undecaprenol N-acetylglucosamine transferase n=1 Tax=Luteipulveratus flavus TaxID=3031728 RepID=A0ABT6C5M4_9MICO|nr:MULTISPECIES: undecaprenyldiphospho-muramoylpentapeptide beta-N-acetylglucosaminyltransferase [unclassified Luteipulveratus]MDE9366483.1 undecaprenyldiphospho-muramoylpentapeptide beta-N-acetylglucosaminyltransferase [Luteipulveratus sp. YIM 133132]MDF8264243.1 undecaprenyldiphospho-muramoylpentapeptide beta-N-acetylglucosaminyltransferase [Luteipulveratus sp. YIM 133296]
MTDLSSVVLAGGGTAGHVSPLLATADALRDRHPGVRITVLGSRGGLEERLVPERGYDLRVIPKVAFPRRPDLDALRFPVALPRAVRQTRRILDEVEPQAVVGFGGFVCPPAYLAARKRIPIVVHEGNAIVGMATKLGIRYTTHVAKTFEITRLPGAELIGMPLRRQITRLDRAAARPEALRTLGLQDGLPTVLVTGGSLGAQRINEAFRAQVGLLRGSGVQVLHVTGQGKGFDPGPGEPGQAPYVVQEYADRMDLAYAAADLVVTRSGGNMVCETTTVGLPAVFVPLPIGNGEQRLNAQAVVDDGGAVLVDDDDFTPEWVAEHVPALAQDAARLQQLAAVASRHGHRDADERLVDLIETAVAAGTGGA